MLRDRRVVIGMPIPRHQLPRQVHQLVMNGWWTGERHCSVVLHWATITLPPVPIAI